MKKEGGAFIWGVLALALGLRLTGMQYGLPQLYHQDEPILVNHAMALGAAGLNPHFFIIGPFSIYFLFLVYGSFFVAGSAMGIFADKNAFALAFLQDPTAFYAAGRLLLGALCGTATVGLVYRSGRRFFSNDTARVAALFLAVAPMHVMHSHFIYADIPLTLAALLFFYRLLRLTEAPTGMNAVWAGASAGLALAVKYTAAYFFPAALFAHFLVFGRDSFKPAALRRALGGGVAALAAFALLAPYTFLDWPEFRSQMIQQSAAQSPVGWWHHFGYSLAGGTGVLFILLAVGGFLATLSSPDRRWKIAAAFGVCYFTANVYFSQTFARYMLPLAPFAALWAAEGWLRLSRRFKLGPRTALFVLAAALVELVSASVYGDALLLQKDTRTLAKEWVEREVPAGSVIAVDNRFFAPALRQTRAQLEEKYRWLGQGPKDPVRKLRLDLEREAEEQGPAYSVYVLKPEGREEQTPKFLFDGPYAAATPNALKALGVQYLILNFTDFEPRTHALLETMPALEKVAYFGPYWRPSRKRPFDPHGSTGVPHLSDEIFARRRLGPALKVYKVRA